MKPLFLFAVTLLFISCSNYTGEDMFSINSRHKEVNRFDYVGIKLDDTNPSAMFSSISKLVVDEGCFYILDDRTSIVYLFDENGNYLDQLNRIGQGPGEYIRLRDIDVEGDMLVVYDSRSNKLLRYDKRSLEFIDDLQASIRFNAFCRLENGNYLMALRKDQGHRQIGIFDESLNLLTDNLDYLEDDPDERIRYSTLQVCGDTVVYSKPGYNNVYLFSRKDGELLDEFEIIIDGDKEKLLLTTPLVVGQWIVGNYADAEDRYYYQISQSERKSAVAKVADRRNDIRIPLLPLAVQGGNLYAYMYNDLLERIGRSYLSEEEVKFIENGGFLLCAYDMRASE